MADAQAVAAGVKAAPFSLAPVLRGASWVGWVEGLLLLTGRRSPHPAIRSPPKRGRAGVLWEMIDPHWEPINGHRHPTHPSRTLVESQQRVRHPLERIRGTIRTYVGLEGVALLLTAGGAVVLGHLHPGLRPLPRLRLGLGAGSALPPGCRAVSLGILFLCGVVVLRFGLLRAVYGDEVREPSRPSPSPSHASGKRFPVWLRLPLVGAVASLGAGSARCSITTSAIPRLHFGKPRCSSA